MVEPTIEHTDDTATIAVCKNLLVAEFKDFATLEHANVIRDACRRLVRDHEDGFGTVVLMTGERTLSAFNAEVRRELTDVVKETEDTGLGTAFVIMREGFAAATLRAVLSGLFLMARSREPNRAFQTPQSAASWLEQLLIGDDKTTPWLPGEVETALAAVLDSSQSPEG